MNEFEGWQAIAGLIIAVFLGYLRIKDNVEGFSRGRRRQPTDPMDIPAGSGEGTAYERHRTKKMKQDEARQARMDAIRAENEATHLVPVRTSQFASEHLGMQFEELAGIGSEWRGGAFGKHNSSRIARDIIYGFHGKFPVVMFNYAYMRNGEQVKRSITGAFMACMLPLINVLAEPDEGDDSDDFGTESIAFNETFRVEYDEDARNLSLQAIPPTMMDFLLTSEDAKTEFWIERGWIFTSQDIIHSSYGELDEYTEHLEADFEFITRMVKLFPPYLARERENPRLAMYGVNRPGTNVLKYVRDLFPSIKDTSP